MKINIGIAQKNCFGKGPFEHYFGGGRDEDFYSSKKRDDLIAAKTKK